MKTKVSTITLILFFLLVSAPRVFGQGTDPSVNETKELYLKKTASYDYSKHQGSVTLESYLKGEDLTGDLTYDIMLLWETSAAMNGNLGSYKGWQALSNIVSGFVDKLLDTANNGANAKNVKMKIVTFNSNAMNTSNDFATTALTIKSQIPAKDEYSGNSGTMSTPLEYCYGIMKQKSTMYPHHANLVIYLNAGNDAVNNTCIDWAYKLKSECGSTFASILLDSQKDGATDPTYMNYCSTNYPFARSSSNPGYKKNNDYYIFTNSPDDLQGFFNTLADKILLGGPYMKIGEPKMLDYVTSDFKLPTGATATDIKIYTSDYKFNSATKELYWDEKQLVTQSSTGIHATINGKKVSIEGFDYSANWAGPNNEITNVVEHPGAADEETIEVVGAHGKKLIVEVPFVFDGEEKLGVLPTNTENSGVYDGTTKLLAFPIPELGFCNMTIYREDLNKGENAIYEVRDGTGKLQCIVALVGDGSEKVGKQLLLSVPSPVVQSRVTFSVTEASWSWAYTTTGSKTQTLSVDRTATDDSSFNLTYTFKGPHKSTTPLHDESIKINKMK